MHDATLHHVTQTGAMYQLPQERDSVCELASSGLDSQNPALLPLQKAAATCCLLTQLKGNRFPA